MSPDAGGKSGSKGSKAAKGAGKRSGAGGTSSSGAAANNEPFAVVYFRRRKADDPAQPMPGLEFLDAVPPTVVADMAAVLDAVAKAPPHKFAGGGKWEAMHGDMSGLYEVRVDGPPNRRHYRLFCLLDTKAEGRGPMLVVLDGDSKAFKTEMPDKIYKRVRKYRDEYFKGMPRRT